jgi:hypothetical protein
MKFLTFILLLLLQTNVLAKRRDNIHFPILAFKAQSLGSGNTAYISYPGSNATSSFLTNAYMFGITDNFDFGVIPLFYTFGGSFFNTTYRYQLLDHRDHQFSLSLTHLRFATSETSGSDEPSSNYSLESNKFTLGLTYNSTPQSLRFNYAITMNYKRQSSDFRYFASYMNARVNKSGEVESFSDSITLNQRELEEIFEGILEMNYYVKKKVWIGFSLANLRRDGVIQMGPDEDNGYIFNKNQVTIGSNISYQGELGPFSHPSVGVVHFSQESQNSIMFNTVF